MGQRNAPIFLTLVHVRFEGETIHPIFNPKVSLVILALMLVGDLRVEVEKRGKRGSAPSGVEGKLGGGGMRPAILDSGIESDMPRG